MEWRSYKKRGTNLQRSEDNVADNRRIVQDRVCYEGQIYRPYNSDRDKNTEIGGFERTKIQNIERKRRVWAYIIRKTGK